ncbi:MAG: FAD-dependent thymidylate synthase [Clostridia bacterium]
MKISVVGSTKEGYLATKEELERLSGHAGGVCYMPDNFDALLNEPLKRTLGRANFTKSNQHHSVFDHPTINLSLENIPKALAMVLNNEGMYTTSEKSARYTKMVLEEGEQKLYDKWLETFATLITEEYKEKCPNFFTDEKIGKLAQENARYLISAFTPTTMVYSVSYRQLNYIYEMLINEINSEESDEFMTQLKPAMREFCTQLEETCGEYLDRDIELGVENKNRKLSLIGRLIKPEQYFGDVYSVSYKGSLAQLAQAHRHRTIRYNMTLLEDPEFFVPPLLVRSHALASEWIRDCESQASKFPQGLLVNINEFGNFDAFILKMKERMCACAQLEINDQTNLLLKMYISELKKKNHPRAEELEQYSKGSRCTFPDYTCVKPCGFTDGIKGDRLI